MNQIEIWFGIIKIKRFIDYCVESARPLKLTYKGLFYKYGRKKCLVLFHKLPAAGTRTPTGIEKQMMEEAVR